MRSTGALLILVVLAGCAGSSASASRERGRVRLVEGPRHAVRSGETLSAIAERYRTTVEVLVALNGLDDPDRIFVGQRLKLPEGTQEAPPEEVYAPPPVVAAPSFPDPVVDCAAHASSSAPRAISREGFVWPVDGVVLTRFGQLEGRRHDGLAIGAPLGTPVWATRAGQVVLTGEEPGYGRLVVLAHPGDRLSIYGSLERACVQQGVTVRRGALLGLVGVSSGVASPRLYFELRDKDRPINPRAVLP